MKGSPIHASVRHRYFGSPTPNSHDETVNAMCGVMDQLYPSRLPCEPAPPAPEPRVEEELLHRILGKPEDINKYERLHPLVEGLLSDLTRREQNVLRMRFGLDDGYPKSYKQISGSLNLPEYRVIRIENRALWKLHDAVIRQKAEPSSAEAASTEIGILQ